MRTFLDLCAIVLVLGGTVFSILGVMGFVRLPDVYTRLHAAGKVSVFGVILLLGAAMIVTPLSLGNSLIFILVLMLAGPVGSHALASAAYRIGIDLNDPARDELADYLAEQEAAPQLASADESEDEER